ncbi:hypothetical protein [Streptomyces olivaceiscleroticus]|uniref:Integral membrane protein n=1 Tax=Streptomyces olivaceiscleroticus TaxID=68245 RepID=A0ABN1AHW2_9ACTN
MSTGQVRTMVSLMAQGAPVHITSMWATAGKLTRLAHLGELFGYQYADARYVSGGTQLLMVPDLQPQAQQRAQQTWAQFPQAATGGPVPPLPAQAPELLRTQINFDLTGRHHEKRRAFAAIPITVVVLIQLMRDGADAAVFWVPFWVLAMCLAVGMIFYTRKRHTAHEARLQQAGYVQVTDPTGRVHYVPPGSSLAALTTPPGVPHPGPAQTPPQHQPYAQPSYQQQPQAPHHPQPYGQPQPPQQPYGQPQQPYGQPPQQF